MNFLCILDINLFSDIQFENIFSYSVVDEVLFMVFFFFACTSFYCLLQSQLLVFTFDDFVSKLKLKVKIKIESKLKKKRLPRPISRSLTSMLSSSSYISDLMFKSLIYFELILCIVLRYGPILSLMLLHVAYFWHLKYVIPLISGL